MTTQGDKPTVLFLPIRSPRQVARGGLASLYREFTDPSEAGDTLTMLKKYAAGLVPGCMGLVFVAVGTLVVVLFSRQLMAGDKKTWLPLVLGVIFGLAGLLVFRMGVSAVFGKACAARPAGREPWTNDNDWDPRGALPDNPTGTTASIFGRLLFLLLIGLFNVLWTIRMAWTARLIVTIFLGVFDLIALAILYGSVQKIVQKLRVGTVRLTWQRFPFFTGGRFEAVFHSRRAMRPTGPPGVSLRRVEQRPGGSGTGLQALEAWSATKTLAALGAEPLTSFPIAMDIPAEEPGTDLSQAESTYWQLLVSVPVTGPDFEAVFLVPIYAPRR